MEPEELFETWINDRREFLDSAPPHIIMFLDQAGAGIKQWAADQGIDPCSEMWAKCWMVAARAYHGIVNIVLEMAQDTAAKNDGLCNLEDVLHDGCPVFAAAGVNAWLTSHEQKS